MALRMEGRLLLPCNSSPVAFLFLLLCFVLKAVCLSISSILFSCYDPRLIYLFSMSVRIERGPLLLPFVSRRELSATK